MISKHSRSDSLLQFKNAGQLCTRICTNYKNLYITYNSEILGLCGRHIFSVTVSSLTVYHCSNRNRHHAFPTIYKGASKMLFNEFQSIYIFSFVHVSGPQCHAKANFPGPSRILGLIAAFNWRCQHEVWWTAPAETQWMETNRITWKEGKQIIDNNISF